VLDLKAGYWQIPLDEDAMEKTAFTTPDETAYHFKVMPFGLQNGPATFQKLMAGEVSVGYLHKFTLVYLDDIIVYSYMSEHATHLRLVFERLRIHGLRVSAEKCQIAQKSLDYLGFKIDGEKIIPQKKHLEQVRTFKEPKSKKQLQSFLGTCGWLCEHVPRYSDLTAPLTELLKGKSSKVKWTATEQAAFDATKEAIAQSRELYRPHFNNSFIL